MQDTHSDWHLLMVLALVVVAGASIFQTVVGLNGDKLGAAASQRMFATVVASAGDAQNPKVERYAKQLRTIEIGQNGNAVVRGMVTAVASRGLSVKTWGGEWKVALIPTVKIAGQRGKMDLANVQAGDYVVVEGLADGNGSPLIAAKSILDFTVFRSPREQTPSVVQPVQGADGSASISSANGTNTQSELAPRITGGAPATVKISPLGTTAVRDSGALPQKAPLQKSMDQ